MPVSKAKEAETAARRTQLIRLRLAGVSFDDPRILGLGYKSRQHASKDMIRALKKRRDEQDAAVSIYRQQQNMRLDALLEAVWPYATTPSRQVVDDDGNVEDRFDRSAVDVALRLMERAAKLNGLDMPTQTELSGPDGGDIPLSGGSLNVLNQLIGIAGQTGPFHVDEDQDAEGPKGESVQHED